ncbi:hypothetical protein WL29_22490 [Burkholderia ubonensis]|uniref:Probable RNA 2'-phosphotransferase n=1 Tax=Burkholderia ubonensis TaxID=101571 RepID=A0A125DME5_9BURK|nr:RNA 2'-phosphotransferase [Burkholderia ubonensis]KWA84135.1 hypothetical protein WL29_22490 [Burkholderia ubonensis]
MNKETGVAAAPADLLDASRFLSFVLRHRPEEIGLTLDKEGWANIEDLIAKAQQARKRLTRELIEAVVMTDNKGRYGLSADGSRIRAVQGHSSNQVALSITKTVPPVALYHGTASRYLPAILKEGLVPQSRHYVHLSADVETAAAVGLRHAKKQAEVVILTIDCKAMLAEGGEFFLAENGVWLAKAVPARFLKTEPPSAKAKR